MAITGLPSHAHGPHVVEVRLHDGIGGGSHHAELLAPPENIAHEHISPRLRLAPEQMEEFVGVAPWAIAMAKPLRRDHLRSGEVFLDLRSDALTSSLVTMS
jgi:hypothetical protein